MTVRLFAEQKLFPWCLAAVSALALAPPAMAVTPVYNIVRLGLDDLLHTSNNGFKFSLANQLNQAGQVSGYSDRYNGGIPIARTAWLYDGATTINIGLSGIEHTANGGIRNSVPAQLNEAGQVTGYSTRYSGVTPLGQSAWLYDGTITIDIGLAGTEHARSDGYKYSWIRALNEAGHVTGYSSRYNGGGTYLGQSVWLYDGATTIDIGLGGAEHTRNDGFKDSSIRGANESGQVTGTSERYNGGGTYLGQSVWLYDGGTTIDIGLTGAEYTSDDGYKHSYLLRQNGAGQVAGTSKRYNDGADWGTNAWLYDGGTRMTLGFDDLEQTRNDGFKSNSAALLNEAGQVAGWSERFNGGGSSLGQSVWLYDGATTVNIGLTEAEHTRYDGYKSSVAVSMNEAGQVLGYSERYYVGGTISDLTYWLYDGAITTKLGLTGAEYARNDGTESTYAGVLNESGQVAGYSERFNGDTSLGQDAWLYDPVLDRTFSMLLSARSDGYAFSRADYLGEDGLVLGTYRLFESVGVNYSERAFCFSIADGLHDLGSLVDGGLAANGWSSLANAIRANGLGQILGYGLTSGQMAYLLTPLRGDYNRDGVVDAMDYNVWKASFGSTFDLDADGNGNGVVDAADYAVWRNNLVLIAGTGSLADSIVPEPICTQLAGLAMLMTPFVVRFQRR